MAGQSKAVTEAKEQAVRAALHDAVEHDREVTIRGVARAAGVDHVFIQRREGLKSEVQAHVQRRGGMNEDDVYRARGTASLTGRERAFVDQARRGEPMGRYIRQALLEKAARDLGYDIGDLEDIPELADTARRPAPRRPNRERQQ
jgi:hypothetical protein